MKTCSEKTLKNFIDSKKSMFKNRQYLIKIANKISFGKKELFPPKTIILDFKIVHFKNIQNYE